MRFANAYNQVGLFFAGPTNLAKGFEAGLQSRYAGCMTTEIEPGEVAAPPEWPTATLFLALRPDIFPLNVGRSFDDERERVFADPIAGILNRLQQIDAHLQIDLIVRPASLRRIRRARRLSDALRQPALQQRQWLHDGVLRLATSFQSVWKLLGRAALLFIRRDGQGIYDEHEKVRGHNLFEAVLQLSVSHPPSSPIDADALLKTMASSFAPFTAPPHPIWELAVRPAPFLLTANELGYLWHPTTATVGTPTLLRATSRQLEPPVHLPVPISHDRDVLPLGRTHFHDRSELFGIRQIDRLRHCYVAGKTGMGKSTLLQNMIVDDMRANRGVLVIDPHGELCDDVMAFVPPHRREDLISFNPAAPEQEWGINLLADVTEENRAKIKSNVLETFFRLFEIDQTSAPRLTYILQNCIYTLLDTPGSSLIDIEELLISRPMRNRLIRNIKDTPDRKSVLSFWEEFQSWNDRYRTEAIAAVLNKVSLFTSDPVLRRVLEADRKQINLRRAMDEQKIILVNLSKGRIGDFASSLLGSFIVTALQIAAMSRAELPASQRIPFFAFVDEFQNFTTDSFATLLSESRKYGLGMTLANQFLGQIDRVLNAVLGNVGTLMTFQIGSQDAHIFAEEFGEDLQPRDIMRLPQYTAYIRLMVNGTMTVPFSMKTLPPPLTLNQ